MNSMWRSRTTLLSGLIALSALSPFSVAQQVGIEAFSPNAIRENFDSFSPNLVLTTEVPGAVFSNAIVVNGPFCPSPPQVMGSNNTSLPHQIVFPNPVLRVGIRWDMDGACCDRLPRAEFYDSGNQLLGVIATGNPGGPFGGWQHASGIAKVVFTNSLGGSGDGFDDLIFDPICAIVTQQPSDREICPSQVAAFSVSAVGTSSISYRWQVRSLTDPDVWTNLSNGLFSIDGQTQVSVLGASSPVVSIGQLSYQGTRPASLEVRCRVSSTCGPVFSQAASLNVSPCDCIDFNNDGSSFDPQDIDAFLSSFSEGPCVPSDADCNDIDFNNDGSLFDPCDIDSFLTVFSEGPCTACGG